MDKAAIAAMATARSAEISHWIFHKDLVAANEGQDYGQIHSKHTTDQPKPSDQEQRANGGGEYRMTYYLHQQFPLLQKHIGQTNGSRV